MSGLLCPASRASPQGGAWMVPQGGLPRSENVSNFVMSYIRMSVDILASPLFLAPRRHRIA